MSEANLYKQLKSNWKFYIKRYETALIGAGLPDCQLVNDKQREIWVELKYLPKAFVDKKLPIRDSQFIWFLEYKGKHAFLLFKIENELFLFKRSDIILLKNKIKYADFCKLACLRSSKIKDVCEYLNICD